jgi:hypothetical protein
MNFPLWLPVLLLGSCFQPALLGYETAVITLFYALVIQLQLAAAHATQHQYVPVSSDSSSDSRGETGSVCSHVKVLLLSLLDLPFSISPVVTGLMLMLLYGRAGWFAQVLAENGLSVVFAFPGGWCLGGGRQQQQQQQQAAGT